MRSSLHGQCQVRAFGWPAASSAGWCGSSDVGPEHGEYGIRERTGAPHDSLPNHHGHGEQQHHSEKDSQGDLADLRRCSVLGDWCYGGGRTWKCHCGSSSCSVAFSTLTMAMGITVSRLQTRQLGLFTSAVSGHAQEGQNSPYHLELRLRIARGDPCNGGDARGPGVFGYLFTRQ